jgi:cobalt-zinc-cadmium efflux system protein
MDCYIFAEQTGPQMAHHHHHTAHARHHHGGEEGLAPMPEKGTGTYRALIAGILLNLVFVVVEAGAGFWQNSLALLSDAGHNLFDVASLALALLAFRLARVKPNDHFTYGYRKTTILVALLNAVILLIAIGGIGIEAVGRLMHPEPLQGSFMAIIAAAGILINGLTAWLFMKDKERDLNMKAAYLHMAADALVSFGVVIAGLLIMWMHWYWLDPAISFVIMIVILVSTWGLLRDSFKMTIDAVPSGLELEEIKKLIIAVPHVQHVHHVHVWPLSTTENALTAHVVIDEELPFDGKLEVIDEIKHRLEHHQIQHSTIEMAKKAH